MTKSENTEERSVLLAAAKDVCESTCQLFLVSAKKIRPHGCSILVTHNSRYYCLSNSHVLNRIKFPQVYFLDNNINPVLLEGDIYFSEKGADEKSLTDTFDVAILEFTREVVAKLTHIGYKFLAIEKAETSVSLLKESVTMIAAYPANRTKFDFGNKKLKFNPLIVRTKPSVRDFSNLNFPRNFHHIVKYSRKSFLDNSSGRRTIAPKPHGMSGSGLWILAGESSLNCKPYLIGILSEYDENRSLIFSTKIDLYISVMQQVFDSEIKYSGVKVDLSIIL